MRQDQGWDEKCVLAWDCEWASKAGLGRPIAFLEAQEPYAADVNNDRSAKLVCSSKCHTSTQVSPCSVKNVSAVSVSVSVKIKIAVTCVVRSACGPVAVAIKMRQDLQRFVLGQRRSLRTS